MINNEQLQEGAQVFFHLLENKILPLTDAKAHLYMEDPDVREVVRGNGSERGLCLTLGKIYIL